MSGGMKAKLDSWSKQYTQDADCCDGSNLQILDVSQHDGGGGPFFALKTDRWAFDSIAEVVEVLRDAGVPDAVIPVDGGVSMKNEGAAPPHAINAIHAVTGT